MQSPYRAPDLLWFDSPLCHQCCRCAATRTSDTDTRTHTHTHTHTRAVGGGVFALSFMRHIFSQRQKRGMLGRSYTIPARVGCSNSCQQAAHSLREAMYSLWGSNPRPMAHKTIALTTELRELSFGA